MKNRPIIISVLASMLLACQPTKKETSETEKPQQSMVSKDHHSATINTIFEAHGGYDLWTKMKQLSYEKEGEKTVVDLQNRKIRLDSEKQTIGFNGESVWVAPDTVDASRARFYHNLYFYFYAMPFVVGDPGVFYEDMGPKEIAGKTYNGVKISYGNGVGDSPKDNYIIWADPETNKMEWLMYTVTYKSGEPSENYRLISYSDWKTFDGLSLPTKLEWYEYKDGVAGNVRNKVSFENSVISKEPPSEELFEMPANAQIAPGPAEAD